MQNRCLFYRHFHFLGGDLFLHSERLVESGIQRVCFSFQLLSDYFSPNSAIFQGPLLVLNHFGLLKYSEAITVTTPLFKSIDADNIRIGTESTTSVTVIP